MNNAFRKLLSKIHLNSIKNKMFVMFIIISILPILVLTSIYYINSVSVLKDQISKSNKALLVQTINNLDNILKTIEDKMWSFKILDMQYSSKYIGNLGDAAKYGPGQALEDLNFVMNMLASNADTNGYIDSIYLYSKSQNYLVSSRRNYKIVKNIENYDWYNRALEGNGNITWMATREVEDIDLRVKKQLLSATLLIKNNLGQDIGVLCINLNSDIIKNLTAHINIGETGYILISDEKGNIINHKEKNLISTNLSNYSYIETILRNNDGYFDSKIDSRNYMITYFTSNYTKWKFATIIPSDEFTNKIYGKLLFTLLICIICISIAVFFSLIISNNLYKPIKVLKNEMKRAAEGDFTAKIDKIGKDEFSELNTSFNAMVENIDNTIKELYKARLLKKDAELKALQAQINPHFLYNTLDSMYWMARLNKTEELSTMISSFSKFLKINLSKGRDIISIKEVVEEIEYYTTIQKLRFGDKFNVEIEVEKDLYSYSIVKFLLQPLVENAIYHGIERKRGKGVIRVIGRKTSDEHIEFFIIDDGVGMSAERLEQVLESIEKGMGNKNFALVNVSKRIQTIYGEEYKLAIKSQEGIGTEVHVVIPVVEYQNAEER